MYFSTNWGLVTHTDGGRRLYSSNNSELHDNHLAGWLASMARR